MLQANNSSVKIERFDQYVMSHFGEPERLRAERERILSECMDDPEIQKFALSKFVTDISPNEDEHAFRTIVDFFTEKAFMPSMNDAQARSYLSALLRTMDVEIVSEPKSNCPIVLESIHHVCSFSANYIMIDHLIVEFGYTKVILLHQHKPLDVRAQAGGNFVAMDHGVEFVPITLDGNWYKSLLKHADEKTIVVYMGDMPPKYFEEMHESGRSSTTLKLSRTDGTFIEREGFSIAQRLKRSLNAQHAIIDYPDTDKIRLFFTEQERVDLVCPMGDWLFWPGIQLYETAVSS